MSIWGKIFGSAAGLALGGPIGAILGLAAGHAVDVMRKADRHDEDSSKRVAFTTAAIVLGAKMAKADGLVTKDEIRAFREVFHVPPEEMGNVGRLFNQARKDSQGYEPYARQIARLFERQPQVLEELLAALVHIANADGKVTDDEVAFLRGVANIFGVSSQSFEHLCARTMGPDEADPYPVLGVSSKATNDELKAIYRRLIREHHPDRLVAQGMPEEFVAVATEKMANINAAYERIKSMRGIS